MVINNLNQKSNSELVIETSKSAKISNLSFSYNTSRDDYVLINDQIHWPENIISSISLFNKLDYERVSQPGFEGEGPPSLTISVFKNPSQMDAKTWAETNSLASNIKLIGNLPVSVKVGGAEGIYYLVLGLYFFDTYVFAYKDEIYLVSGAYNEKNGEYYQNISDVISTIAFK